MSGAAKGSGERIRALADERQEAIGELLRRLVAVPSTSGREEDVVRLIEQAPR